LSVAGSSAIGSEDVAGGAYGLSAAPAVEQDGRRPKASTGQTTVRFAANGQ
jgi:hypothetical protein